MRILADLPHPKFKITFMYWNERYFIKLEYMGTELIYKFREGPLMNSQAELQSLLDHELLKDIDKIYDKIMESRQGAIKRQEKRIYGE